MRNKHNWIIFILVILNLLIFTLAISAQDEEIVPSGAITKVDLGVSSLNLKVGETYTFRLKFEPEDTVLTTLNWYVTDDSVISIDPLTDTVTALADGEARIFAESFDQVSYAVCAVTVGESISKDASIMKSGNDFLGISQNDLKKITAGTLTRYLDFVSDSAMDDAAYEKSASRMFDVLASVKAGTEEAQAQLAKDCGIEDSEPLKELNAVTLYGSLDSILKYVKDNKDLKEIFEFGPFVSEDPIEDEVSSESIQKAVGLQGYTEQLTAISYAHKMGLNGKGRWIAVIDSGINRSNSQFSNGGRTIIEACFSKSKSSSIRSVCPDGSKSNGDSAASKAIKKANFNHGSHVTGIAAGRNGIAPLANIISIQSHTESVWTCKNADERNKYACTPNSRQCCKSNINNSDLARAYDYILELSKTRKIDAVNMSYGTSTQYKGTCDNTNKFEKNYFDKMRNAGILPVVSSGNNGWNSAVGSPACLSNAYTVGNITMKDNKAILAKSSNHGKKVDITAPGTKIYSAGYSPNNMMYMSGTSMATPMVSGAAALVKQMYPGMTPEDTGNYLKSISKSSVNRRINANSHFTYAKPILNFSSVHKLSVPYYNWITGGNKSITFQVYRMAKSNVKFGAEVTTMNGTKISGIRVQTKSQGDFTYIRVSGNNLQNGQIYKVKLTRSFKVGGVNYWSSTTEYGRPYNGTKTPTVRSEDKGLTITAGSGGARYFIYDAASGKLVKQLNVPNGSNPITVRGLVNGRLYRVTARPYQKININKNGVKKAINFYGPESGSVIEIPMSAPFNANASYPAVANPTSTIISCSADKAVTGIRINYRKTGTKAWTPGVQCEPGKFTCTVPVGRGYDFQVLKYKTLNGTILLGPAAEIKGR